MAERIVYGLALSGGGARGASHAGVLKALEEEGMIPSWISGTSAGALAAGLYACGLGASELEAVVSHLSRRGRFYLDPQYGALASLLPRLLSGRRLTLSGLLKGNRLQAYFYSLTEGKNMDEACLPLVIPAVDLNSGDIIAFTNAERPQKASHVQWEWEGRISQAMMASASFPGVFAPRRQGSRLLVDGGVAASLPVELLRKAGVVSVVAVDVGSVYEPPSDVSLPEILTHSFSIMSRRLKDCGSRGETVLLTPPQPPGAGLLTFETMEDSVKLAYEYTKRNMPAIQKALQTAGHDVSGW